MCAKGFDEMNDRIKELGELSRTETWTSVCWQSYSSWFDVAYWAVSVHDKAIKTLQFPQFQWNNCRLRIGYAGSQIGGIEPWSDTLVRPYGIGSKSKCWLFDPWFRKAEKLKLLRENWLKFWISEYRSDTEIMFSKSEACGAIVFSFLFRLESLRCLYI